MTKANEDCKSLVLSPATRSERVLSRLTLGHLLGATLLSGALIGSLTTSALQEETPERVIPSVVHWETQSSDLRMNAEATSPFLEPVGEKCEAGAFLGIEFRRDHSFAPKARWNVQRKAMFELTRPFARALHQASGVTILNVLHGTTAEAMGLLPGDVIVEMDGIAIRSAAQLAAEIRGRCIGERTQLRVHRGEQIKRVRGALRSRMQRRCALD